MVRNKVISTVTNVTVGLFKLCELKSNKVSPVGVLSSSWVKCKTKYVRLVKTLSVSWLNPNVS